MPLHKIQMCYNVDASRSLVDIPKDGYRVNTIRGARDDDSVAFINSETTGYFYIAHSFVTFRELKDAQIYRLGFGK